MRIIIQMSVGVTDGPPCRVGSGKLRRESLTLQADADWIRIM